MRRVVMIAYTFPPEGSAGAYRPLRFVRHLRAEGCEPHVVTSAKRIYERYDPELLERLPAGMQVVRVPGRDRWMALQAWRARRLSRAPDAPVAVVPRGSATAASGGSHLRASLRRVVQTAQDWRYHPDTAVGWIRAATATVVDLCRRDSPRVLWATIGPVSSGTVAWRASRACQVPYVLDFRDPWGLGYYGAEARRPSWINHLDRRTLSAVLGGARAVIFQFAAIAECYCRAYPETLDASRIHIIPNGYEGDMADPEVAKGDVCRIAYTGTLSTYYAYDTLLDALVGLKRHHPSEASQLRVTFVGDALSQLADAVSRRNLADIVAIDGPHPHAAVQQVQRDAHALLILGRETGRKGHELVAGAKLFEYLKARRPILGIVPHDETRNVLVRVGSPLVADAGSPPDIEATLRRLLACWNNGTLASLLPDRSACASYSAGHQTHALARALDGASPFEPYAPGSVDVPPSLRAALGSARRRGDMDGCTNVRESGRIPTAH